tara:strand:- start:9481 stop:10251 length:771 start_codon:yes stop_codon:yes gene_type:complete
MKYININKKNKSAYITINNEKHLNALNKDLLSELSFAINDLDLDKSIRVLIITGEGDKAFAAGADIKEMYGMTKEDALKYSKLGSELFYKIETLSKPVIAAINGYALGGGCELAMSCHIRYATSNAVLGQPEVKLGLITGFGGSQRITKNLSKTNAMEMLLSGRNYTAQECKKIGLINDFFESKNELFDRVNFISKLISENGSNSVEKTIELINRSYDIHTDEGLSIESIEFGKLFEEQESNEGLESFIQKRKPNF